MRGALLLLILMWVTPAQADVIYVTPHRSQADIVVFVTKTSEGQPHWKAPRKSAAKGMCHWFFTKHQSQAEYNVYFTKNRSEAELIIRWVKHASQAHCDVPGC